MMKGFIELTSESQLDEIDSASRNGKGVLIYKHSTRCFISSMAQRRLSGLDTDEIPAYYLDLLRYRSVSNAIAEKYGVGHQSPQLLWIVDGKCVEHTSHEGVSSEVVDTWMEHA
ncbi:bacillithiol system redox-active protein YtxJ [Phaeocystidibacter marisrubri]|nr:bacillithiol system redox-active protein YtxJ [Phaeocystidibacter marisrubri]GGH76194.1 thioredoxin family protein [Phaeocystidibacter marisrubri]